METKDATGKNTLLDNLVVMFHQKSNGQFSDFALKDFFHVYKAKRLVYSHEIGQVDDLQKKLKVVSQYQSKFIKQDPSDRMGDILGDFVPESMTVLENLAEVKF